MTRISLDRMVNVLGAAPKPLVVWEKQFDGSDEMLLELAKMDWNKVPDEYLCCYFLDMAYVELQPDLFRHLFPTCLKFWYDTLMNNASAERGEGDFHYSLLRGNIVKKMLSEKEAQSLYDFFHDGFLDRIEAERGFVFTYPGQAANGWIFRFNSLGYVAPVIKRIWESWWALDNPGKAVCAIMYASGLVYLKGENPIYGQWTPETGGGGPYLTECDGGIYDWAWRDDNLTFLLDTLSSAYIIEKIDQAAATLSACPEAELAAQIAREAKTKSDIISIRIDDMLENLAKIGLAKDRWD